jgi:FkbM family methyltransferase
MSEYHYRIPLKTKLLNLPRRLFMHQFIENLLSGMSRKDGSIFKKFIPPEYLYPKNSWRIVSRKDLLVKLDISNVVDHEIYFNLYDRSFEKFLNQLSGIRTYWDVGANIGWTILQTSKKFPQAELYAFEPSSRNRSRLSDHINMNEIKVEIVPKGLGSSENSFKLYSVLATNPGMNRIIQEDLDLPFETIDVIKGDDFWKASGKPHVDALKMDVEGFEMQALSGMREMLSTCRPVLFIEVDDENLKKNGSSATELVQWLIQLGYNIKNAQNDQLINNSADGGFPPHFDIIAK